MRPKKKKRAQQQQQQTPEPMFDVCFTVALEGATEEDADVLTRAMKALLVDAKLRNLTAARVGQPAIRISHVCDIKARYVGDWSEVEDADAITAGGNPIRSGPES